VGTKWGWAGDNPDPDPPFYARQSCLHRSKKQPLRKPALNIQLLPRKELLIHSTSESNLKMVSAMMTRTVAFAPAATGMSFKSSVSKSAVLAPVRPVTRTQRLNITVVPMAIKPKTKSGPTGKVLAYALPVYGYLADGPKST
jgi:hypothetical protein